MDSGTDERECPRDLKWSEPSQVIRTVNTEVGEQTSEHLLGSTLEGGSHSPRSVRSLVFIALGTCSNLESSKMESFIRSKYESRRWAMDGPPPSDPSALENGTAEAVPEPTPQTATSPSTSRPTHATTSSTSSLRSPVTNRQPQPHHQLLSASIAGRTAQATTQATTPADQQPAAAPAAPAQATSAANNDLFSLDFHNPTPPANNPPPRKDVKQDILSLFSTPTAAPAAAQPSAFGQFGSAPAQPNVWGGFASAAAPAPAQQANAFGAAMWGAPQQNLWAAPAPAAQPAQPAQQQSLFNTNDVWASPSSNTTAPAAGGNLFGSALPAKKDDVFGDIWGGFK